MPSYSLVNTTVQANPNSVVAQMLSGWAVHPTNAPTQCRFWRFSRFTLWCDIQIWIDVIFKYEHCTSTNTCIHYNTTTPSVCDTWRAAQNTSGLTGNQISSRERFHCSERGAVATNARMQPLLLKWSQLSFHLGQEVKNWSPIKRWIEIGWGVDTGWLLEYGNVQLQGRFAPGEEEGDRWSLKKWSWVLQTPRSWKPFRPSLHNPTQLPAGCR